MTVWAVFEVKTNLEHLEEYFDYDGDSKKNLNFLDFLNSNFEYKVKNNAFEQHSFVTLEILIDKPISITDEFIKEIEKTLSDLIIKYFDLNFEVIFERIQLYIESQIQGSIKSTLIEEIIFNFKTDSSLSEVHKQINCPNTVVDFTEGGFQRIKSAVLGLLLLKIKRLQINKARYKDENTWIKIIIKYFDGDKDVLECQGELIEKGYKQFAKLKD